MKEMEKKNRTKLKRHVCSSKEMMTNDKYYTQQDKLKTFPLKSGKDKVQRSYREERRKSNSYCLQMTNLILYLESPRNYQNAS